MRKLSSPPTRERAFRAAKTREKQRLKQDRQSLVAISSLAFESERNAINKPPAPPARARVATYGETAFFFAPTRVAEGETGRWL